VTTICALQAIGRAMEDVVLQGISAAHLALGARHMSAFRQEAPRYRQIAGSYERIWVCAVADDDPPEIDGVTFAPISPDWPVADEWFVVVNAPGFACALLATEAPACAGLRRNDRCFQTMFTSDARLVNAICRSLSLELDLHIEIPARRDPEAQQLNLRRFNQLALEYQERQTPRHSGPRIAAPRWTPPLSPARPVAERVVGGTE
jgi:DICT domain-containing protein